MIDEEEIIYKQNENEHAIQRFSMMLDVIENGDCVEDFSDSKIITKIRTLTVLLRQYINDQNDEIENRAMLEKMDALAGTLGQPLQKNEKGEWVEIE